MIKGNLQKALHYYRSAFNLVPKVSYILEYIDLLIQLRLWDQAEEVISKSISGKLTVTDSLYYNFYSLYLNEKLVRVLFENDKLPESKALAIQTVNKSKRLSESLPNHFMGEYADALLSLGVVLIELNEFSGAKEALQESNNLFEKLADNNPESFELELARVKYALGLYWFENITISFDSVAYNFNASLVILKKLISQEKLERYEILMSQTEGNLGVLYSQFPDSLDKSFEAARNAYLIFSKYENTHPGKYKLELAIAKSHVMGNYMHANEPEVAISLGTDALLTFRELAKKEPDKFDLFISGILTNLGDANLKLGNIDKCEEQLLESLSINQNYVNRDFEEKQLTIQNLVYLSEFYSNHKIDKDKAIQYAKQAVFFGALLAKEYPINNPTLGQFMGRAGIVLLKNR